MPHRHFGAWKSGSLFAIHAEEAADARVGPDRPPKTPS
jgi:hypothetical protein